ncbi:uncharacterized protein LOC133179204 [Saccostrea echinata]|uniref:uncharacterized protein LOC133179204 n=1 Tax=Saccostrea echinata TaxID=191078 RepID=UPI002A7EE7FE|nr:uncharacterized protein LOC133179204 [Saccostrea echinata]
MKQRSLFLLLPFVTTLSQFLSANFLHVCHGILNITLGLACTSFPSDLTGDWTDSSTNKGVDFKSSGVTGWDVTLFGRSVNSWTCVDEDTDQILLASSPVKIYGLDFVVYRCMKYKKLSNCSYKITFNSGKEMNAGNQRVFVLLKGDKDANGDSKATVALCNAGVVESRTIRKNTCS